MNHDRKQPAVTGGVKGADCHLVPLPGSEWAVWRDAVLRTAGFPADGLDRFAAPQCAAVADACLDGRADRGEFESAYAAACTDATVTAAAITADPLFREAVTWQNPVAAAVLAALPREADLGDALHQRKKWRKRADLVARYWQRYCGKNDTIGFFGPVSWATIDPRAPAVTIRRGPGLIRSREVCYEYWALEKYVRTGRCCGQASRRCGCQKPRLRYSPGAMAYGLRPRSPLRWSRPTLACAVTPTCSACSPSWPGSASCGGEWTCR